MASKLRKRRGLTLAEMALAVALMGFVLLLGVQLVALASRGVTGFEIESSIVRNDAHFASLLNDAVRESTTAFTIPEQSFTEDKLTAGWNYLGLMNNVYVPEAASVTGKAMTATQAMVFVEYAGETAPDSVPDDCNLLHNEDGYFYQKILGHSFTDSFGTKHNYTFKFEPTDSTNTASQTIIYEFKATTVTDGNIVEIDSGIDVNTMLNALNAIQVVYKGSPTNPAVALAYRSDFMPSDSAEQGGEMPAATVVMVLDTSNSMSNNLGNKTRMEALKENVDSFVTELSKNKKVKIVVVPFGNHAGDNGNNNNFSSKLNQPFWNGSWCYNAFTGKPLTSGWYSDTLSNRIDNLTPYSGWTNVGDGLRRAYYEIGNVKNTIEDMGKVSLLLMTDGQMNTYSSSSVSSRQYTPYYGSDVRPPYLSRYDSYYRRNSTGWSTPYARMYAQYWSERIVDEYMATGYLIDLAGGMGAADKQMLESVFQTTAFNANSLTAFSEAFTSIAQDLEKNLWAFEGPKL